jgi:signal transduction histidine kinase
MLAVVGRGEPRALLTLKAVNIVVSTAITYAYAALLASLLNDGLSVLSASVAALQSTRETTKRLSLDLSERVTSAVAALAGVLDRKQDAGPAVEAVVAVLAESRRVLPAEPALPEIDMPARLLAMRRRLATWVLRLVLAGAIANLIVHLVWPSPIRPPPTVPLMSALVSVVVVLGIVDALRPRWFVRVNVALHVAALGMLAWATVSWLELRPGLPPSTSFWGVFALLATAVVGLHLGVVILGVGTLSLVAGVLYPPFNWTLPLNLLLAYGLVCWLVHDMPRQLVARLSERRAEAVREIRLRRRLVATLFHDLANPLTVVQTTLMFLAEGSAEPDDLATMHEMVDRMQAILEAATGRARELRTVSAGHLFHAMDQLFAKRLQSKGVALRTHGPAQARVVCRETLLTESVLGNLVSNALKFSPPGAEIDLRIEERPDSVVIAVEDRGPGLPAEVREALATGRSSVSRLGTAGEQGHGHGLMLAQDYVREMGGSLELAEREGGGLSARVLLKAG